MSAYSVIVADPPWAPRDKLPGKTRGAAKQYRVMSTRDIEQFVNDWNLHDDLRFADDAVLFLWRLASMQEDALAVAKAWGFTVKSEVVWRKLTKDGLPWFGMGRTVRASHEACLIATRGRASKMIASHSVRSVFDAKVPLRSDTTYMHSAKPEAFWTEIVEPLIGDAGPRIELFARRRRPGWDAIGDQLPVRAAKSEAA